MSVGANPSGITPKVAQQVVAVQSHRSNQANQTNQSRSQAALRSATAPTNSSPTPQTAAATAVNAAGVAIGRSGGTTAPAGRGFGQAPVAPASQAAATMAAASIATNPAAIQALTGLAIGANRTRISSLSGDADKESGDVKKTESEEKNQLALKDSNSETGNEIGDMSGPNSAGGPST